MTDDTRGQLGPYSVEAEKQVLGAMMMNRRAVDDAAIVLAEGSAFHFENFRTLYRYMLRTSDAGKPVTLVQLTQDVARIGLRLDDENARALLADVGASVGTSVNVKHDAHRVLDLFRRRQWKDVAHRILQKADNLETDVREIDAIAERAALDNTLDDECEVFTFAECVDQALQTIRERAQSGRKYAGISSGYDELDQITGGFRPGEFIVIAARPSVGKTALALNIMQHVSAQNIPAAFFSLEMAREPVAIRLISSVSQVEEQRINTGEALRNEQDAAAIERAGAFLAKLPGYVGDPRKAMTCTQIRAKARRLVNSPDTKVRALFVDYLHLIEPNERAESRVQELERISKSLKALARELNVPVIVLSQLNRETEQTKQKPKLHNLKGSGAIEQDADVVIMMDREDDKENSEDGYMTLRVEKNRNGRTGKTSLSWFPSRQRFASAMDHDDE